MISRSIVNSFWSTLGNDVLALNNFDSHPETATLKPSWLKPMFIGAGLSILNYDVDSLDLVRGGMISVHISDIAELGSKTVYLTDETSLPADTFICCTGWKSSPSIEFLPSNMDLGVPHITDAAELTELIHHADAEIFSKFPRLRDQPPPLQSSTTHQHTPPSLPLHDTLLSRHHTVP